MRLAVLGRDPSGKPKGAVIVRGVQAAEYTGPDEALNHAPPR